MSKSIKKSINVTQYIKKRLKNKVFKREYDDVGKQLDISYRIAQLRKRENLSQIVFAKRIGTTQSNVARMEQGRQNFTIGLLSKVARALNKESEVTLK